MNRCMRKTEARFLERKSPLRLHVKNEKVRSMVENLGDMAIGPRFSFWKIGKRQPRVIPKGIEGPLHKKTAFLKESINRARFLQFREMRKNMFKFRVLSLEGLRFRGDL